MAAIFKTLVISSLIIAGLSKQLHLKEDFETKDKGAFMDLFKDEAFYTTNERHARHIELVTESVIDHLLGELKHQYYNTNYNANSPIRRLIRNLNKEMKRNEHGKLMKERQKKKIANKKKHSVTNKNKKITTDVPLIKQQTSKL